MGVEQTHCTALALFSLELPLMSNVAANSIFPREDQLNLFTSMYLAWRHSNGANFSAECFGPACACPTADEIDERKKTVREIASGTAWHRRRRFSAC